MNKFLIVLLIVGLVSVQVHGFVKRDTAPATDASNGLGEIGKQLESLGKSIQETWEKNVNTEDIKKQVNAGFEKVSKAFQDFTKKSEEAPKTK